MGVPNYTKAMALKNRGRGVVLLKSERLEHNLWLVPARNLNKSGHGPRGVASTFFLLQGEVGNLDTVIPRRANKGAATNSFVVIYRYVANPGLNVSDPAIQICGRDTVRNQCVRQVDDRSRRRAV